MSWKCKVCEMDISTEDACDPEFGCGRCTMDDWEKVGKSFGDSEELSLEFMYKSFAKTSSAILTSATIAKMICDTYEVENSQAVDIVKKILPDLMRLEKKE